MAALAAAPAVPVPIVIDKDKLTIYLVSGGDDGGSFYNALYGALKYYMKDSDDSIISENLTNELTGGNDLEKTVWVNAFRKIIIGESIKADITGNSIFYTIQKNDEQLRPYQIFSESFQNKINRGAKFKAWLEAAPKEVQEEFGPVNDVYQSKFYTDYFSSVDKKTAEELFYKKLGEIISEKGVPSFETDISVTKYVLSNIAESTLNIDYSETKKPPLEFIINNTRRIFLTKLDGGGYGFFTLNPKVKSEEKDYVLDSYVVYGKTGVKEKNTPRFITIDNQTIDTVDYYQLGINRYGQLSKKYDFEMSLYEKQRFIDADRNVEIIAKNQAGLVRYEYENEIFNMSLRNYSMYTMLMEENMNSIDNIVKLSQQMYDRMVEFLTENFRLLAQDEIITVQSLLTTFREMNAELTQTMEKNRLSSDLRRIELYLSTLTQITELQNNVKEKIHDFSERTTIQLSALNREIVSNTGVIFETMAGVKMNGVNFQKGLEDVLQKIKTMEDELKDSKLNPGEVSHLRAHIDGLMEAKVAWITGSAAAATAASSAAAGGGAGSVAAAGGGAGSTAAAVVGVAPSSMVLTPGGPPVVSAAPPQQQASWQGFVGNFLAPQPQQPVLPPGVQLLGNGAFIPGLGFVGYGQQQVNFGFGQQQVPTFYLNEYGQQVMGSNGKPYPSPNTGGFGGSGIR